jgi:DnaJ family protein C protein 7
LSQTSVPATASSPAAAAAATSKRSTTKAQKHFSYDRDSHPLNLPPDELRRLSAMAAARDRDDLRSSMDIESDGPAPVSSSPDDSPLAFSSSEPNGFHAEKTEQTPTPPPHASVPPPPVPPPQVDPEACKLAGNKFFKAGDFARAIQEYTKGNFFVSSLSLKNLYENRLLIFACENFF